MAFCFLAGGPAVRPPRPASMNTVRSAVAALLLALAAGCSGRPPGLHPGYLEGEFVYVAAPLAGRLDQLDVARGATVAAGQRLFALDPVPEETARAEAEQRLNASRARVANLAKGLRPSEIAALAAQRDRATASLQLAELEVRRLRQLRERDVVAPAELDIVEARAQTERAQVASLAAQLETAQLGGREDERRAAEAEVAAAEAALRKAVWALEQKVQLAPTNGFVHDTLYRRGEWVAAGNPVVVLLPPANIKARFFVPEPTLATLRPGQNVTVQRDGAEPALTATISYIAPQAEFTPPVIYSKESRAKLVYLVEATFPPEVARTLRPGQPIDVRLNP